MSKRAPAFWTDERVSRSKVVLKKSATIADAAETLSAEWGRDVTVPALQTLFRDRGDNAGLHLAAGPAQRGAATKVSRREPQPEVERAPFVEPERTAFAGVDDLVALARKFAKRGGLTVQLAADELDMSPRRTVELFQRAQRSGYSIDFVHGEIAWKPREPERSSVIVGDIAPANEEVVVGVASDLHFGSRYHLNSELHDHIAHCYAEGARDILMSGDLLEGCYRHARWELTHHGLDDQIAALVEGLPRFPGLDYRFILGNHDETHHEAVGMDPGRAIVTAAREAGRNDLHYYGARGANLMYRGTRVALWHPRGGLAYSKSYKLQNWIRDVSPELKPDIVIAGHWHQAITFQQSGVWGFAAGCFQHGDSMFGRSLGGDVSIGGWLLRWRRAEGGGFRSLAPEFRSYRHAGNGFQTVKAA